MDNENEIQHLSSMEQGDFVVLNYNGTDVDLHVGNDVQMSDKHTTMLDEKNLIQSWELLKEENTSLKEQIQKVNQLLIKRIEEMKEMKSAQGKWMEMNETNHRRAKEEILSLREQKYKYKQRIDSIMEQLGQIIQKEMDPECKKYLEDFSMQIREGVADEFKEGEAAESKEGVAADTKEGEKSEPKDDEQSETKENAEQTDMSDGRITKLNLLIAEMTEQLKCKDEQIDLIANELLVVKKSKESMVSTSEAPAGTSKETSNDSSSVSLESHQEELTSIKDQLNQATSLNAQLNKNLTSLQNIRTSNQSQIEGLKADAVKYKQMQEEKSREFDKLRANIAKLQTDKDVLEKSLSSAVKSPPSANQASVSSTEVLVGSAPVTRDKSYKRELSDDGETVQNLMMLFSTERQKCTSLQEKLTKESRLVHDLQMELLICQQESDTKSNKLDKEMSKREKEHILTVEELNKKLDDLSKELLEAQEPRYQSTGENMRALRSQVMALMAELAEMNKQVSDANVQVQKRNERIKSLELKNSVLASEQYNQSMQDTAIIDRLQMEIKRLSEELNGYTEVVEERNDLLMKYKQFQGLYQDVCHKYEEAKHKAVNEEELQEITLKLISYEEASGRKDYQIDQLQGQVKYLQQFEDQCSALRAQAELYKLDFEAERDAREKAHGEKEKLFEEVKRLEEEIEQLKEDQNPARKMAMENLQRRHGGSQPTQRPQHTMPPNMGAVYGRQEDYYPHPPAGHYHMGTAQPPPPTQEYICPVCQRQFPDIDTLQIHVMDCIN